MALTTGSIQAHILKWETALTSPYRPYRSKWPSRLFHHAPIENAVKILQDGNLRSRDDPANKKAKDVAAPGVIDGRTHAHGSARLYFRPRTPTQYHIEGIRKKGECQYGDDTHAPVLVMMVFDASNILALPGIKFCDRNMQLGNAEPGDSEEYFSKIPFDKVFHEGGTGGDRTIIEHRCAEVLAESPLPLANNLQWVYCRTAAERDTLLYLLGDKSAEWAPRVLISDDLLLFERRFVFVESVFLTSNGINFQLSPRADLKNISISVFAWDSNGTLMKNFYNADIAARPPAPSTNTRWRVQIDLANGTYLVQIDLEGHLAFKGYITLGERLV
ncbi:DarT ssDNA thymidine ADP-ribosyltransferase family protein [Bradyrhizobium sp. USDA 372]